MSAGYELWLLHHATGAPLALVSEYSAIDYVKAVNDVGSFTLTLPPQFDFSLIHEDTRLAVWRHPVGGVRRLDFVGMARYVEKSVRQGKLYYVVSGPDLNDLLKRRLVAYETSSAEADKAATNADNQMKAFVRENLGALCVDVTRDLTAFGFTVEADKSLGTAIAKQAGWRNLLDVLQELAEASQDTPATAVYFGMVPLGNGWECEFRTNIECWGADHRHPDGPAGSVIVGLELGSISDATRNRNYRDEKTYVYVGGSGSGATRPIGEASDVARLNMSPFNRCETFVNNSNTADATQIADLAAAELRAGRPRSLLSAGVESVGPAVYGRDYAHGDYITALFDGETFDCRVDGVRVHVAGGVERVDVQLRAES